MHTKTEEYLVCLHRLVVDSRMTVVPVAVKGEVGIVQWAWEVVDKSRDMQNY